MVDRRHGRGLIGDFGIESMNVEGIVAELQRTYDVYSICPKAAATLVIERCSTAGAGCSGGTCYG